MSSHRVEIPHRLSPEDAKARLQAAVPKLESQYGARCSWAGDRELRVARTGLDARVQIQEERVVITLQLGFVLRAFKDKIMGGITRELTSILATPPPS